MLIAKLPIATTIDAKSATAAPNLGPPKTCDPTKARSVAE